ncbi:MAG: 3-oxoacyl-[acyl-carrier-protein] reductase [Candidatus Omnitrophica bacterium]|nr:3-oxoacyl-[acyl-carrier-protein] reductase [Candidatus Omnitrophota bacterium]
MSKEKELIGKTAIVTGATRGIGRAIALTLARQGANVAFNYLSHDELATTLTEDIEKMGVGALSFKVDIKDYTQVQQMKDQIFEKWGRLDILVNNAGIVRDSILAMMSQENWREVMDTNLNGTFNMTKAVIVTFMKQKSGDIVNISSISGVHGMARQVNYSASKGGIIAFTKALAKEAAPFNIRVNALAPGFIETDMVAGLNEKYLKQAIEQIPLQRMGKPEEVAEMVGFLLSQRAGYITGQVIGIDGGLGI